MPGHTTDEQFLHQALDLARQGIGLASPNPCVGAVLVDAHGNVAGTGAYTYGGVKHAEVQAIEQAGSKSRGATLYINLEPCSHQGRTPPCAEAVIAAGIHRVIASMPDPNPKVSGRGFETLRAAGIHVEVGRLEEQARRLNEAFARYIRHGVPLVTLKSAMTLDGKIAPPPAATEPSSTSSPRRAYSGHWITGESARAHVQELRHQNDAILAGIGTILADNPLLTDRSGRPRRRPLLRVILDSQLRLPLDSRLVQSAGLADGQPGVLVFCSSAARTKKADLEARGIRVEPAPASSDGRLDILAVLRRLGELDITSLMIEGGASLNWTALAAGVVDKVFLYYAPNILGGAEAVPFSTGPGFPRMSDAPRVQHVHLHRFGEDFAVEGYLRDPYAD
ncbi:MAG: bifunctional diaminohydroxyphosphoribosylaminopyrimidine deaminase/5-amino-6-(5-phosphoribosylamino)uracil reductase RibD [Candidatus Sulfotelmatobacter sp.]